MLRLRTIADRIAHNHDIVDGRTFDFCGACGTLPASAVPEPTDLRPAFIRGVVGTALRERKVGIDTERHVLAELDAALAATPPGPHNPWKSPTSEYDSREEQIERIAAILDCTKAYAAECYNAGLRAEPSREAEGRDHDDG